MKLSISLPEEDVAVLDEHARERGLTRSAAIHQAIRLLRTSGLEEDYLAAWEDWDSSGDREAWETAAADGLA